jgi:hypothetical protein
LVAIPLMGATIAAGRGMDALSAAVANVPTGPAPTCLRRVPPTEEMPR